MNNIKIILRDINKHKLYSFIKLGGFSLGIATCFLIGIYIRHELSFDKSVPDGDRIYRVVNVYKDELQEGKWMSTQAPMAEALRENIPEIENAGRINTVTLFGAGSNQVRKADANQNIYEEGFVFVDQNALDILQFPFLIGDAKTALKEANTLVITESMAKKYFPGENPLGKAMVVNNNQNSTLQITGVIKDFSDNSSFDYQFMIAYIDNMFNQHSCWDCYNPFTFVKLKPGIDKAFVEKKMQLILEKYIVPLEIRLGTVGAENIINNRSYQLQLVSDFHLKSSEIGVMGAHTSDIRIIWMLGIVAVFILIIACINFINLSTAKSTHKAKEIGLKKTIGAKRSILIRQFFVETIIYSLFSIIVAVLLTWLLLPYLNLLSEKSLTLPITEWWFFPVILSMAVLIGLIAGIYPSLYLTSFKPAKILKGDTGKSARGLNLRNGLVVFQFAASIILVICTLVIFNQMKFILDKDLGFNKEQVLLLHGTQTLEQNIQPFKNQLKTIPGVQNASVSYYLPINGTRRNQNSFWKRGRSRIDEGTGAQNWIVDYDYIETMGMKIVEGRNFSQDISGDERRNCIINQEMAKQLNLHTPIGSEVENGWATWKVVGLVENFHFYDLQENIGPLMMRIGNSPQMISVRVNSSNMSGIIRNITKLWDEFSHNQSIRYTFLDAEYASMYSNVQRMGKIFRSFAFLAIMVACLGLYGLAEFITKEKTKEIGVRKVNGARVHEILTALNRNFIIWVIIALAIACPSSWLAMSKWLETFAYRVDIGWWVFLIAGLSTILIAVATVSFQSYKASIRNPIEALRYE